MGEHTIREVLKRRSDDTQRVIRRRRERALQKSSVPRRSYGVLIVIVLIILIIVAALVYSGWLVSKASDRFTSDRAAATLGSNGASLNLQSTSQFLPNTLLAAVDPNFYSAADMTVSPVTAHLVRMYFPDSSGAAVKVMAIALQYRYSRTDILETFVNDVTVGMSAGRPVRGFASASQAFFKKSFVELQPQDIALLVALATGPADFDPHSDPARALSLRNSVLQLDAQQTVLSQAQVDLLKKTPLDLVTASP
ncbi:MAG: transglycosylase domain-containing protein [Gammaproteobacteria bacterium]|nr:transglycosylase domain-containing protein [Gammaproteobacteria bacterium]